MDLKIQIKDKILSPLGDVRLQRYMKNNPNSLKLKFRKEDLNNIELGNVVTLKYKDVNAFKGYIFKISESESDIVDIIALDQLRYLKNTHTLTIKNKTASQLIKELCSEFKLKVGTVEDTKVDVAVKQIIVENKSLFEIIYNALDDTMLENNKNGRISSYILYDDYGQISLKDQKSLTSDIIFSKDNIIKYSNNYSIDNETYNKIYIYYKDEKEKVINKFIVEDSGTQSKWGVLQKSYGVSKISKDQADEWGQKLLKYFNSPKWEFSITSIVGDIKIIGGSNVFIKLENEITNINKKLIVSEVTHIFNNNEYKMELKLLGVK